MAFRDTEFGLLVRRKPREAKRRVVEVHEKCGYVMTEVAKKFGVTIRTLNRWVSDLGLKDELRSVRYGRKDVTS